MAQFVLVNVVVAVLMKHLEESHRMVDEDDLIDGEDENDEEKEESTGRDVNVKEEEMEMMIKSKTPVPSYVRKLKTPICKQASLPPSFTFRPPSNEPPNDGEPSHGSLLVPVDITISSFDSSVDLSGSSTLDVPLTPSTCYSDNSSYMETNLDNDPLTVEDNGDNMCRIPHMNYLNPNAKTVSPQQKQRFKDRKLVRQKSCDYDSPPITEECVNTRGKLLLSPCQKYREKVSQSQPSLLIVGMEPIKASKLSKLSACPSQRRISYLQRSQSSGAEKARVRDRYCSGASPHRPQNDSQHKQTTKGYSVLHPLAQGPVVCSQSAQCPTDKVDSLTSSFTPRNPSQLNRSSTCDSQSNDNDCSTTSDWTGDEEACDEEVRQITGDDTEEEELGDDLVDSYFSPDIPGERTLLLAEAPEDEDALSSTPTDTTESRQSMIDSHDTKNQVCHMSPTDTSSSQQSMKDSQDSKQPVCQHDNSHYKKQLPTVPCHVPDSFNSHHSNLSSCHDNNPCHHSNQDNKCNGGQPSVLVQPPSSGELLVDLEQGANCDSSALDIGGNLYFSTANKGGNSTSGTAKFPVIHFDDPLQLRRRHCSTNSEDGEC
ncbi:uncharacterized protein LOC110445506 isoform X2 [Mizuhopecten yessoensis]|uniref:uncharacterized protein LOC110445506 isoform X2 n=1 Tax=Mizuhopecten yessoensis TaxID=6573 RepID=UPI000B45B890|nr:uncharacterized protein LOC110445506 isoform X2 [Mizuhopecten yessoensis]